MRSIAARLGLVDQVLDRSHAAAEVGGDVGVALARADRRRSPPSESPISGEASMFRANWNPNSLTPTMANFRVR